MFFKDMFGKGLHSLVSGGDDILKTLINHRFEK